MLLLRLIRSDDDTLAKKVYNKGKEHELPVLWKEVTDICKELDIPDINDDDVPKETIRTAIFEHHYRDMMEEMEKNNGKLEDVKHEDFREVQPYMKNKSVAMGRMAFKIRTKMVADIPGNFKNKFRVRKGENEGLICVYCNEEQLLDQAHCLQCVRWKDLRSGLDMTNIKDLVAFFTLMLQEKEKIDAEKKREKKKRDAEKKRDTYLLNHF